MKLRSQILTKCSIAKYSTTSIIIDLKVKRGFCTFVRLSVFCKVSVKPVS